MIKDLSFDRLHYFSIPIQPERKAHEIHRFVIYVGYYQNQW